MVKCPLGTVQLINYGRDPFNQNFGKFRSKTQWIGSVQPEKFRKTGPPFEVDHFSRSDRLEFWLNGSRPIIPRARMGSESIAHEAEGRMAY